MTLSNKLQRKLAVNAPPKGKKEKVLEWPMRCLHFNLTEIIFYDVKWLFMLEKLFSYLGLKTSPQTGLLVLKKQLSHWKCLLAVFDANDVTTSYLI